MTQIGNKAGSGGSEVTATSTSITIDGVTTNLKSPNVTLPANLIPTMTSATAPSGVASASSSTNGAWSAMTSAQVGWLSANVGVANSWLKYDFGAGSEKVVRSYAFAPWSSDNWGARSPTAWQLQGSNDDTNWTAVHTYDMSARGQAPELYGRYTSAWQLVMFNVTAPGSYRYYRLKITANQSTNYVGLADFRLHDTTI